MIHDGTHDQDLYNEQEGLLADAEALPGKAGQIVPAPPQGDGWVAEAVTAVEASITKLIDEFRVQPCIHRVEHSLHIRLVQLLGEWEHLRGWYPIGDSGFKTQLIHKEWPEARPRKKPNRTGDRRRGSFDLVVLAPSQLQRTDLEQFRLAASTPRSLSSWASTTADSTLREIGRSSRIARSSTHTLSTCHGCHRGACGSLIASDDNAPIGSICADGESGRPADPALVVRGAGHPVLGFGA
jgi:hypothetical protein